MSPRPDVEGIRKRCEAATAAPWTSDITPPGSIIEGGKCCVVANEEYLARFRNMGDENEANAVFVSGARSDIPALLSYITSLETQIGRIREEDEQVYSFVLSTIGVPEIPLDESMPIETMLRTRQAYLSGMSEDETK